MRLLQWLAVDWLRNRLCATLPNLEETPDAATAPFVELPPSDDSFRRRVDRCVGGRGRGSEVAETVLEPIEPIFQIRERTAEAVLLCNIEEPMLQRFVQQWEVLHWLSEGCSPPFDLP